MIQLLHQLFAVILREEFVPPQWREGLIVNFKEEPRNYRSSYHSVECRWKGFFNNR